MKALLTVALALLLGADERVDRLPEKYKDWIEKEVIYIIADKEREAFLNLEAEEEREAFIAAFWQRRDPDPITPVNEFKDEHYRRLEHVNEFFSRESAVPGWMTDRGKIYIILGEPADREDFTSVPMLYPTELWFYHQDREKSLPPLFLLFWQEHAAGPYRLFNHLLDDPEDLMPAQALSTSDSRRSAYLMLLEMSPELAHATITMRADRGVASGLLQPQASALDFQALLSDIEVSPFRRVDTRYVDEAEDAKGIVEAEYLFNYVPSVGMANVLIGPNEVRFVHYTLEIEPQHMTLAHDPDKNVYYTSFELRGEVTTPDETETVLSFTKKPYVQLTETQFRDVGYRAFSYRDMFPLVAGDYRFRVVLKNEARTEYTIFETELAVPERSDDVFLGQPVPLYGMTRVKLSSDGAPRPYRTYQIGDVAFDPNAKRTVAIGNFLMAHVPVQNVPADHELHVEVLSLDDPEASAIVNETHRLDFYEPPVVVRTPLEDAPGGKYRLVVELRDPAGETRGVQELDFNISPLAQIHRPWALRDSIEAENHALMKTALAEQSLRLGRNDDARTLARQALDADPNLVPARVLLARFSLDEEHYQDAIRLLEPARAQAPRNVEVLLGLGDAHLQAKNFERATELLETAAEIRRPDAGMLNALGLAHAELGHMEEAIDYLKRSLELEPSQPNIESLVQQLESSR